MDVIGVGDADVDIYLEVDHVPGQDEKILARSTAFYPGGMVANFLVALSRLGTSCGFHGPVGDDEFGQLTLDDLANNDVDTSGAVIKPGERTYFCIVMLDESGEKALVVAPTGCIFPKPEDLSEQAIAQVSHLHTTAANIATAEKAVRLAKQHGLTISLDLEPSAVGQGAELLLLLTEIDVLFINERAVTKLSDTNSLETAAKQVLTQGPEIVCVTRGKSGSLVATRENLIEIEAFPVDVADSTGAGDCYAAGFVHGYLRDWAVPQTATFASAVGAMSVTSIGGHTRTPTPEQAIDFLLEHGVDILDDLSASDHSS